ncbi:MAG: hypothetical protein RLO18_25495, partial [Gimesia chilikensis]
QLISTEITLPYNVYLNAGRALHYFSTVSSLQSDSKLSRAGGSVLPMVGTTVFVGELKNGRNHVD